MAKRLFLILTVLVVLGGLAALGLIPRHKRERRVEADIHAEHESLPNVYVQQAGSAADTLGLSLPGRVEAFKSADLGARAQGYVKSWTADIGATVKQGQLMATIEQPELEQDIATARTQLDLAQANLQRYKDVTVPGAISRAEYDQALAQYRAAQSALKRVLDLKSFQQITAPFAGVVTARNIDVGSYVQPGGAPLFSLMADQRLRVFVDIPQSELGGIQYQSGTVKIRVPELGGKAITAELVSNTGEVDAQSRTLTVQMLAPAGQGLLPGMYCTAYFLPSGTATKNLVSVPANTLYYSNKGPTVLIVDSADRIHFSPLTVSRDMGTFLLASAGVRKGDRLVVNPNTRLHDSTQVHVLPPEPVEPGAGQKH